MAKPIEKKTVLANGVEMPWLGLGVWKARVGGEVEHAVKAAIKTGYRSIDTAAVYKNEEGVGKALAEAEVPREALFITTKVWNDDQGYETTLAAFEESRKKLGLEYIDLYLIHWPKEGKYKETWKAMEKLYKEGLVRAIGVSNFHIHHLKDLIADAEVKPMVDQVEFHPYLTQKELLSYCKKEQIQMEAWSPLMQGNFTRVDLLKELAEKYGKTPAQIVLRWDLEHGVVTIPKSVKDHRIQENADLFDFELSQADIDKLDALNKNHHFGPDPDNFNF